MLFNLLYALFSALAFISLIPMLNVLFGQTTTETTAPVWTGLSDIKNYGEQLLNYKVSGYLDSGNPQMALVIVIALVISTFILKNLFGYFANQHMMYLKNGGVLNDLRKDMYQKIIKLPLSFYSKRQKGGDVMARILGDITKCKIHFLLHWS